MNIGRGARFVHLRKNDQYRVVGFPRAKFNGVWHDAVAYVERERADEHDPFVRARADFEAKFVEVSPVLGPATCSVSIDDHFCARIGVHDGPHICIDCGKQF